MNTNGTTNQSESRITDILEDEVSVGYKPVIPLESLWLSGSGDMPQITLRRDIEFMQMHPIVSSALEYYKSGISGAEFWGGPDQANPDNDKGRPISPDTRVSQFVLMHAERFWQRGVPMLQEGYPYGWAPGEHIYKTVSGIMVWSHLKGFHPNDGFVLTYKHQPVGIRVKSIRDPVVPVNDNQESTPGANNNSALPSGGTIDLWFASDNIPAKAAWYPHRPRFQQFYGRSQLIGAWRPWRRLGWRDGVEQVVDAAIYRAGYKGPIVKHPPGHSAGTAQQGIPATKLDGGGLSRRENRDVARQMVEWAKAGAGFTLSSEMYPQASGGGPKWSIEWPDHVMNVDPLINGCRYLEEQIMLGIGVPPELVKAGGTGSGYSGRSIPREAFLDGQQRVADAMLQSFVEQVIHPLVLWNFGDVPFNIQCKPLLQTQAENKQGQPQPPLPQPLPENGGGQPNGSGPPSTPQPGPTSPESAPMSLDLATRDKALAIAQRVLRRRAS